MCWSEPRLSSGKRCVSAELRESITEHLGVFFQLKWHFYPEPGNPSGASCHLLLPKHTSSNHCTCTALHHHGAAILTALARDIEPAGARRGNRVKEALTCGSSTQHRFGEEKESKVAASMAHGARALVLAQGSRERPVPAHGNSSGPHWEVRMKFPRRSALRLNEGPQDSSCDGIKQRCMILYSASFGSCAYDSLLLLSAFPGISERPVWSHTIYLAGIFILVLHYDQFLYLICF